VEKKESGIVSSVSPNIMRSSIMALTNLNYAISGNNNNSVSSPNVKIWILFYLLKMSFIKRYFNLI